MEEIGKNEILAILENIEDGLIVFDKKGKVSLVNSAAENFFEVKREDILGRGINDFLKFQKLKYIFYLLGEEIKEVYRKEMDLGDNLILEVTVTLINSQGNNLGKVVILHDVTREKTADKMKTEFVSVAAHQLRTPLSAIKWIFEKLSEDRSLKLNEKQQKLIREGIDSADRVISIVNDLLDIVRIEEGREVYKLASSDFEKVLNSVIETYQEVMKKRNIKFEYYAPSRKLPKIKMDPQKISLVVQNLLDNAIRYTPPGGIVRVEVEADREKLKFSISDTGIGIPEKEKIHVFKKFFRSSNAIKFQTEGNGIGLYIAKNIIKAHGGEIWFESEENKGTTFYFTLPIKK